MKDKRYENRRLNLIERMQLVAHSDYVREELGISSVADLEHKAGLGKNSLARLLSPKNLHEDGGRPRLTTLYKFADICDCSPAWLCFGIAPAPEYLEPSHSDSQPTNEYVQTKGVYHQNLHYFIPLK